jgi:hypothetical protein
MFASITRFLAVVALAAAAGCDGFLSPEPAPGVENGSLTVVRVAPDAPTLDQTEITFWMVRGEQREVEIRYLLVNGYNGKCLRLVIPAEAPLRDAEGRNIAPGDSVQVTVRVLDPELFLFELEPAGLLLNPAHPARLEIRYRWMSLDVNGDGRVDAKDDLLAGSFRLWAQNPETLRWSSVPSTRLSNIQEIHAPISVFTRYALASD